MGSYGNAILTGFVCRLCSKLKQKVTHLYSNKARELELLKKIKLLPIKLDKHDKLPKSICDECIQNLNIQFTFLQKVRLNNVLYRAHAAHLTSGNCPINCPLHDIVIDATDSD